MSFEFSSVEKAKAYAYFKQVEGIYLASFLESQIRPTKMIIRMLQFDPNYHLILAQRYDTIVGFSLLYAFKDLNAAFLDFMAIERAYRDRGLGSNLLRYTVNASMCQLLIFGYIQPALVSLNVNVAGRTCTCYYHFNLVDLWLVNYF